MAMESMGMVTMYRLASRPLVLGLFLAAATSLFIKCFFGL